MTQSTGIRVVATLTCFSWLLTALLHTGGICVANATTTTGRTPGAENSTAAAAGPQSPSDAAKPGGGGSSGDGPTPESASTPPPPPTAEKRSRVAIPLSFVIENRNFTAELDNPMSDAFRSLERIVTFQLDQVFKNSTLKDSYITSVVRRFWRGSVGVTSDLLFDTLLGGAHPDAVSDAFLRGTHGGTRLGELGVSGPIVPGVTNEFPSWSIALLALTSTILLLNIIVLLACAVWCCRRGCAAPYGDGGGTTELYYTGETASSYPLYDTHGTLNQSKAVLSPYVENSGMTFTNKGMESPM
ncbi:mucin-1-like [Petromyzon marinus]|uniref:mucin-1-like n=1 Tax=Petromyzon marinus TaxID=7757 RepID=UPI003F71EEA7